ncbi:plasminogen receptor (KT)-like [Zerene cesonia]|uniref:plasminogen receptor (KT)-like n=1 Tax=Zerene cesonia TaxID=33412 RepID=UPI0018E58395|nr:plasminogen receptor (KT)-like [Zerene cesonia]
MGGLISINIENQYKKNEKFLQSLNEIAIERQIQLQNQMAERQKAAAIAGSRDFFLWFTTFHATVATGLLAGFGKTKKPFLLVPLVPLSFVNLYYYDLAYGNKLHRIRMEAEHIMSNEADILKVPCGLPTPASIDERRKLEEETKKIHPPMP